MNNCKELDHYMIHALSTRVVATQVGLLKQTKMLNSADFALTGSLCPMR